MDEQSIFTEALEKQDPVVRGGFLDRACAGNPDLRQRIERLLHQHQIAGSFLESPAPKHLSAGKHDSADSQSVSADTDEPGTVRESAATVPTHIGRYCVERVLGSGNFGVVYLAHDPQLDRPVAIKVPRSECIGSGGDVQRYPFFSSPRSGSRFFGKQECWLAADLACSGFRAHFVRKRRIEVW